MGNVKEIIIKVIPSKIANDFMVKHHYSESYARTSQLHFGAFINNQLHGVMSFGSPIDKRNIINFVETSNETLNQKWNEMLELNRMAFDELLPKNSESRSISVALRLIKKKAPQIKWILSFADGTQCGDGTIYRASGFKLCGIKKNSTIVKTIDGEIFAKHGTTKKDFAGAIPLDGFQLKYIYLLDKTAKINLPILEFSKIKEMGAKMYKGQKANEQG